MSCLSNEMKVFIKPWLDRVAMQFEPKVKKAEKTHDSYTAQENLATNRLFAAIIANANQRPTVEQNGLINTHNVTHHHTTHVYNAPSTSSAKNSSKTKEAEEKKEKPEVNWKNVALITFTCTVLTSISVFVYIRLAKTEERAQNYLAKTKLIKEYAEKSVFENLYIKALKEVAEAQQEIDQKAVNKITGYKKATLVALVGVVTAASGAIAMPWFAAAGAAASIFGMLITAGSTVGAAAVLATHWSDEKDAQEKLNGIHDSLVQLNASNGYIEMQSFVGSQRQPAYNPDYYTLNEDDLPPSYAQSQQQYGYGFVATENLYPTLPNDSKT